MRTARHHQGWQILPADYLRWISVAAAWRFSCVALAACHAAARGHEGIPTSEDSVWLARTVSPRVGGKR
ncbi:MAG: hypothetical protein HWD57_20535 [Candidatus Accumulibacter cognatus]|uniref:Uncharacterized protein n=1 Tax=Candidatus Accumulibacter cognatus TaxID=2954383 RepID=A0A7D5NDU1_9PROT|nr:MAG: hypothetical protein HWD57_20535 [Candidatus Accumulibacter cognatus]